MLASIIAKTEFLLFHLTFVYSLGSVEIRRRKGFDKKLIFKMSYVSVISSVHASRHNSPQRASDIRKCSPKNSPIVTKRKPPKNSPVESKDNSPKSSPDLSELFHRGRSEPSKKTVEEPDTVELIGCKLPLQKTD